MNEIIKNTIDNLKAHNIAAYYTETQEALIRLLQMFLKSGEVIGCGDSTTLEETGVFDFLRKSDYAFLDKH